VTGSRRLPVVLLAAAALTSACGDASSTRSALRAEADSIAAAYAMDGRWNGGLLVARDGSVVLRGASGLADRESGRLNTPDMPYDLFSISKPFTAIVVLQLVESGHLALDGTLASYLPDYPGPGSDEITIHHLLSHTAGVPDYVTVIPGYWDAPPDIDRDSVLSIVAAEPLEFEPGDGFGYTNTGYVLLAAIVERVTGRPFEDLLSERIFEPLGMDDTHWTPIPAETQGIATGYRGDQKAPVERVQKGEAGIVSTLDDMLLFARALGSDVLLSPASWELAFTPHADPARARRFHPAHFNPYGYGFSLSSLELANGETARVVSHGGAGSGGTTMLQRVIDGDGVVLLWNNDADVDPGMPEMLDLVAN
jgi:CubicO group peptidase (beta-lactamase class C family)